MEKKFYIKEINKMILNQYNVIVGDMNKLK